MSPEDDEVPAPVADCWDCGEATTWEPTERRGYEGFECSGCGSFQEGGLHDEDGTWWEVKDGAVRRKDPD